MEEGGREGIELTAVDTGPGIANLAIALRDGYSTGGTAGTGLGALHRLPSSFDIYSTAEDGTALTMRVMSGARQSNNSSGAFEIGVINLAKPGQEFCGDSWAVEERSGRALFLVVDGLGHGADAFQASAAAVRTFHENADLGARDMIEAAHLSLRPTRGAAIAVAEVQAAHGLVKFAGLGNISGTLYQLGSVRHMMSHDGTAGHQAHRINEFSYPWSSDSLLIMHSDGLSRRWNLEDRVGLASKHPSIITAVLFAHHYRQTDDVTVLAARVRRRG
jgi:hypothetical protein